MVSIGKEIIMQYLCEREDQIDSYCELIIDSYNLNYNNFIELISLDTRIVNIFKLIKNEKNIILIINTISINVIK